MLITFCINNTSNNQNLRTRQQRRTTRRHLLLLSPSLSLPLTSSSLLQPAHVTRPTSPTHLQRPPLAEAAQIQDSKSPAPWPPTPSTSEVCTTVGAYFYYLTLSFAELQLIFGCSLCVRVCVGERCGKRGGARRTYEKDGICCHKDMHDLHSLKGIPFNVYLRVFLTWMYYINIFPILKINSV